MGATALVQGGLYFGHDTTPTWESGSVALTLAGIGAALLIGFLTPIASTLIALATVAMAVSWLPLPPKNLIDGPVPIALMVVVAIAIACLGPGSLSLDSRLFGRREIIIPQTRQSPRF